MAKRITVFLLIAFIFICNTPLLVLGENIDNSDENSSVVSSDANESQDSTDDIEDDANGDGNDTDNTQDSTDNAEGDDNDEPEGYVSNIADYNNTLGDNIDSLQIRINDIKYQYNLDVLIFTTNVAYDIPTREYVDNFYDENGYGIGDDRSGIILVLDLEAGQIWTSAKGNASTIFNDAVQLEMYNGELLESFSTHEDYYTVLEFLNYVEHYAHLDSKIGTNKNVADPDGIIGGDIYALQERIESIGSKHALDFFILATDNVNGKTSQQYADDFLDYMSLRSDKDVEGLLLLIDLDNQNLWISSVGKGIDTYTDERLDSMLDDIIYYAADGYYYEACESYLDNVDHYAQLGVPGDQYQQDEHDEVIYKKPTYFEKLKLQVTNPITYILPVIIGMIITLIASLNQKGRVTVSGATYEEQNSFFLADQYDTFLRKTVTTAKRNTSSSNKSSGSGGSSGRSSTHKSSSGRTHGGRGRSL